MKVGLVHGRFQPFHNGHKFLVNEMLRECQIGVICIGSAKKKDKENPYSLEKRKKMIGGIYKNEKRLLIGANIDFQNPLSDETPWDILLASCVLSLTSYFPTHIYGDLGYNVLWKDIEVKIKLYKRYRDISGTFIRQLIYEKDFKKIEELVPFEVLKVIMNDINGGK